MPKKTDLPQRIVAYLKQHPSASRKEISRQLGVSYQAAQKHLRRLEEDGLVRPGFLVSESWDAGKHEFWIFIATRYDRRTDSADGDYQDKLCRAIAAELGPEGKHAQTLSFGSIQILLGGDWDIVLRVRSADADAVGRFVTRYLRSKPNVVRTSTAWSLGDRAAGVAELPDS